MVDKSATHTGRIATISKAIETAIKVCKTLDCAAAKNVTVEIEQKCKEAVNNLSADAFVIDLENVKNALKLVEIANMTKLALSA
jgi:hypothetical protein